MSAERNLKSSEPEGQPPCRLVIVHWVDSRQPQSAWRFLSDLAQPEPVVCASVGWLVKDGLDCKLLCPNMGDLDSDSPQGSGFITIPTACITKIETLAEEARASSASSAADQALG